MRNFIIAAALVTSLSTSFAANTQYNDPYGNYGSQRNMYDDDRYYYDDDFDWHWDIRVRITNGIQNGLITRNESNRLYRQLENIERKEYMYLSDGVFNNWEQQEIWDDVVYLNRIVGVELYDYDRRFYGFDLSFNNIMGYPRWYYRGGFDFNRFDRRGFGSIRLGYMPRSNYNGWYRNNRNQVAREYYNNRNRYQNQGSDRNNNNGRPRGNDDNRRTSRNNREGGQVNPDRSSNNNPRGGYEENNSRRNSETRRNSENTNSTPRSPRSVEPKMNENRGRNAESRRSTESTNSPSRTTHSENTDDKRVKRSVESSRPERTHNMNPTKIDNF